MNIDRHNYEMYFLLYVDNELSAEERNAVEQFVAENIDLATEFELLKQTALPLEEIVFTSKPDLYKNELKPDRLQEQMLLHLDNELDPLAMNSLSAEIADNDDLKREWNILQQTKLDSNEKIVFENKELLYRHEKDRVIPMFFWRAAAAILIIGTALFIGIQKFGGSKDKDAVAISGNSNQQPSKKINQPKTINADSKENNIDEQQTNDKLASTQSVANDTNDIQAKENNIQRQQPGKNIVSVSRPEKNNVPGKNNISNTTDRNNNTKSLVQKEHNNLPKPYFENINNQERNKTVSSTVQDNIKTLQNKNDDKKVDDKDAIAKANEQKVPVEDIALTETNSGFAKNTVLSETGSETGNNSILFVSEDKVNRSKLGGFLRKVKRMVARNTNIKSGNSVKIAGFEIATR